MPKHRKSSKLGNKSNVVPGWCSDLGLYRHWVVGIAVSEMIHIMVLSCTSHFLSNSFPLTELRWTCTSAVDVCMCGGANIHVYMH